MDANAFSMSPAKQIVARWVCSGDARRVIDQAVYDLRLEISEAETKLADERGEPPLDDDA